MASILAIDPAWTERQPSGVALLEGSGSAWRSVTLAPSYRQFLASGAGIPVDWSEAPAPGLPDVDALLDAAVVLLDGAPVDLVTIDMPVATVEIAGRRAADSAISREFGGRGCSTHSPSSVRPGVIGNALTQAFSRRGYPVATTATTPGTMPALVEVYPHTALLALMGASYRVPYKVSRAGLYWPETPPLERRHRLAGNWVGILDALGEVVAGIDLPLPQGADLAITGPSKLKRFEDALDALICGWVGIRYTERQCEMFGDASGAIWTPQLGSGPADHF